MMPAKAMGASQVIWSPKSLVHRRNRPVSPHIPPWLLPLSASLAPGMTEPVSLPVRRPKPL